MELLLNSGYNSRTNTTVIPKAAFDHITSAQVVASGLPNLAGDGMARDGVSGYGAGWIRETFLGRDVSPDPRITLQL